MGLTGGGGTAGSGGFGGGGGGGGGGTVIPAAVAVTRVISLLVAGGRVGLPLVRAAPVVAPLPG